MNRYCLFSCCIIFAFLLNSCGNTSSLGMNNMVATMEVKEPIEGVCDNNNVVAILPLSGNGQVEASQPISEEELEKQLNAEVSFLQTIEKDYEDKGMVNIIVNCKGEMVQCYVGNKTKSAELDLQIEAVFKTLTNWTAGSIRGRSVDTIKLYSFTISQGKISLN